MVVRLARAADLAARTVSRLRQAAYRHQHVPARPPHAAGRPELMGMLLTALNISQSPASFVM